MPRKKEIKPEYSFTVNCILCKEEIDHEKHVAMFIQHLIGSTNVTLHFCKGCITRAWKAKSHDTIYKDGVIPMPTLCFEMDAPEEYRDVAVECGWATHETEDSVNIVDHFQKAIEHRWWSPVKGWVFDSTLPIKEVFRKSCINIARNYGQWYLDEGSK